MLLGRCRDEQWTRMMQPHPRRSGEFAQRVHKASGACTSVTVVWTRITKKLSISWSIVVCNRSIKGKIVTQSYVKDENRMITDIPVFDLFTLTASVLLEYDNFFKKKKFVDSLCICTQPAITSETALVYICKTSSILCRCCSFLFYICIFKKVCRKKMQIYLVKAMKISQKCAEESLTDSFSRSSERFHH